MTQAGLWVREVISTANTWDTYLELLVVTMLICRKSQAEISKDQSQTLLMLSQLFHSYP